MRRSSTCLALCLLPFVVAHGGGEHQPNDPNDHRSYAEKHMATEHHIDSFDPGSFFAIHDLNRDGFWDKDEIEAIYGVHHVYSKNKSEDDEEHSSKAEMVVNTVLRAADRNGDGKVSLEEFVSVGFNGLPDFSHIGIEGHHYDVESEFFLHHEEQYHNTPETQTDEAYNHPEDLEHFAQHEAIERKEAEKEAKFQGISVEEALRQHEHQPDIDHPENPDAQKPLGEDIRPPNPKVTRVTPPEKQDPVVKFQEARKAMGAQEEWGKGDQGYKRPANPAEKMRKNLPYKYKFRRNWGDF